MHHAHHSHHCYQSMPHVRTTLVVAEAASYACRADDIVLYTVDVRDDTTPTRSQDDSYKVHLI